MFPENTIAYLLPCNLSLKDQFTNSFSFISVFSQVKIPSDGNPAFLSFHVGGKILNANAGKFQADVVILDPDEEVIGTVPLSGVVPEGDLDIVAKFKVMKFTKIGKYLIHVKVNGVFLKDGDKFYFEAVKA